MLKYQQSDASPPQDVSSIADTVLPPPLQLGAGELRGLQVVQHCGVFALFPQLVAVWLQAADKHVHGDLHHVFAAGTLKDTQGSGRLNTCQVRLRDRPRAIETLLTCNIRCTEGCYLMRLCSRCIKKDATVM